MVFFDEPLLGIDPKGARYLKDLLLKHSQGNGSVLISSHTLTLIEEICHKIYVMDEGRIVSSGSLEDLRTLANDPTGNLESVFLKITEG
jgi:ABC-2 type transport system ATP-binding protein